MAGPRAQDGGARGGGGRHLSEVATGPSVTAALLDAAIGGSGRWRRRRRSCPLRCGLCAVTNGRHVASKGPRIPVCGHWAELDLGRDVKIQSANSQPAPGGDGTLKHSPTLLRC
ncbi:uncharacterized protein LOC144604138 isoform X1 [Rhinoraja longicauda]